MTIHVIETGNFKLDGGAMFGVVPKSLWSKKLQPDENNMCTWSLRLMLIENGDRLILVDTGLGDKQSEKFFSHYYLHNTKTLEQALNEKGFSCDQVTDVVLTHLHFDHCGGAVKRDKEGNLVPAFKNARYWSNKEHWTWATAPNARERASFLPENILPLEEHDQLYFAIQKESVTQGIFPNIDFIYVNGHTEAQMLPLVNYNGHKILYCADLFPSVHHLPLPWVMSYDVRPLVTMQEKEQILPWLANQEVFLFFEHDSQHQMAALENTDNGVKVKETLKLSDLG